MHAVSITGDIVDRVIANRGVEHVYADFDVKKTALVVIDMQNAFMLQGVAHNLVPTAVEIVPNINAIAAALRAAGGTVVWIYTTFGEESLSDWPVMHGMSPAARTKQRIDALAAGSIGHEFWKDLEIDPHDMVVKKTRYSAFLPESSDLAEILRAKGLDSIIITGTLTNGCCESSARDAMMMNFKVIMATDANAAVTDKEHNATLISHYLWFGDVLSTDQILGRIAAVHAETQQGAAPAAAQ